MSGLPRTIVIGGGVIGCAIAYRLVHAGHAVTLLERDRVGAHASGAAAGLLAPFSEGWTTEKFADSAAQSLGLFPELVSRIREEAGIDAEFRETESLRLAFDAAEKSELEAIAERLRRQQEPAELLDQAGVRRLEPELGQGIVAALRVRESQLTPIRFVEGLARAAGRAGAEVLQSTPAVELVSEGSRVGAVRTPSGRLGADWVVVAAGPWTPEVTAGLGVRPDVQPRRGQLVALAPDRPVISRILTRDSYYLVPKPDGSIVAGSTEEETGFDARATVEGVRQLLEKTQVAVPALRDATITRVWAGIRPYTPSGLPVIRPADRWDNVILATGHHRDGILLAPITADIVLEGLSGSWREIG